nr:Asp-tRNA(Asn)/Glu-tRNA(Gln) amidotransferase subunit GatA [Pyrofollis japonicus]
MEPYRMPAWLVREELAKGNISVEDYVGSVYERIERLEPSINAFITLRSREEVMEEVREAVSRGGKLAGVLVAVKDNIHVKGLRVTCGSKMLEHYVAPYDATVIKRLRESGAVVIGKTNMDEFAMGSTGETSAYGATRNPWELERVPGGSSSGSAAAVAAGMATLALGSDTGGSIRLPASWTGLYGLKPTYGLVSRYGLVSYADSLEQIGPMARDIVDLALLLEVIAGFDPLDATSLRTDARGFAEIAKKGLEEGAGDRQVLLISDFLEHPGVDPEIRGLLELAADKLGSMGVEVSEKRLGDEVVDYALPAYYVIAMAEASSNLARYDGIRYGPKEEPKPWESWNEYYSRIRAKYFGLEVKTRIILGSWMLSAGYRDQYYIRALKVRRLVRDRLLELLRGVDALLLPSAVTMPPRLGEVVDDPEKMYALDLANVLANLSGLPALVAPVARVSGIPVGVQLVSKPLGEKILFLLGGALEAATGMRNLVVPTN